MTLQADGRFRSRVEDINLIQVRNKWGQMVPLGTLVYPREITGPVFINRYNLYCTLRDFLTLERRKPPRK